MATVRIVCAWLRVPPAASSGSINHSPVGPQAQVNSSLIRRKLHAQQRLSLPFDRSLRCRRLGSCRTSTPESRRGGPHLIKSHSAVPELRPQHQVHARITRQRVRLIEGARVCVFVGGLLPAGLCATFTSAHCVQIAASSALFGGVADNKRSRASGLTFTGRHPTDLSELAARVMLRQRALVLTTRSSVAMCCLRQKRVRFARPSKSLEGFGL